jgi:hypothetical protein
MSCPFGISLRTITPWWLWPAVRLEAISKHSTFSFASEGIAGDALGDGVAAFVVVAGVAITASAVGAKEAEMTGEGLAIENGAAASGELIGVWVI